MDRLLASAFVIVIAIACDACAITPEPLDATLAHCTAEPVRVSEATVDACPQYIVLGDAHEHRISYLSRATATECTYVQREVTECTLSFAPRRSRWTKGGG